MAENRKKNYHNSEGLLSVNCSMVFYTFNTFCIQTKVEKEYFFPILELNLRIIIQLSN